MTSSDRPDAERDAIEMLITDHRTVDSLFDRYERLGAGHNEGKRQLVDEMIGELSVHAAIEEQQLYPFLRDEVPGGEELADRGIEDHQAAKEALAALEGMDADSPDFDATVAQLITDVRAHIREEEAGFFPRLRQVATGEQLRELGADLDRARSVAPTRPHPRAPSTPPGNVVAGPLAGAADRVRDAVTKDDS